MSEKKHNELIDHIRESLQMHEEPYAPGAWETFRQHRKSKRIAFAGKVALSIAASLILLLSLLFILNDVKDSVTEPEQPVAEYQEERTTGKSGEEDNTTASSSERGDSFTSGNKEIVREETEVNDDIEPNDEIIPLPENTHATVSGIPRRPGPVLLSPGAVISGPPDMQMAAEYPADNGGPASYREHYPERVVKRDRSKNFSFGLTYAPLMNGNDTKTDWSMGGGLYTEWNFARDFAFSSGLLIAQNQLEYDNEVNVERAGMENFAYLQVDLMSLEIPLNLRYYLTDNISVSAGISSAAFLKEDYNYTYEYQREIQTLRLSEETGFEPVTTTVTVKESDKQSEPSLNAVDWAAFYTFSVGYQYDIAGKHTLSLEPFMKLPSGHLTTRNIKYYTGGMQLKISF